MDTMFLCYIPIRKMIKYSRIAFEFYSKHFAKPLYENLTQGSKINPVFFKLFATRFKHITSVHYQAFLHTDNQNI